MAILEDRHVLGSAAKLAADASGITGLIFAGAIFGFFYAWVCSTMWGLDQADPRVAIIAMQEMNRSVRNAVFAPAFFGTPFVLALAAVLNRRAGFGRTAIWMALAAVIYGVGGMFLTMKVNVPMNEALGALDISLETKLSDAHDIWKAYSGKWQLWNTVRTLFSGLSLMCVGLGLLARIKM
ncbi:DUF1772 domain-containing protein [Donghicola mangrovi]|uniref:DUF1772 domain-containing protein n=1 Tax=Donghicola mangrovi TaxID=2729614 RepID=A0A850Q9G0_9RHOB|nr:anthrone oxygenase family protein [Donghicola mangrovi]NVO25544.1 DUF1772 domain-containing protein [Donghicola mangrovi]